MMSMRERMRSTLCFTWVCAVLVLACTQCRSALGAKILGLPAAHGASHMFQMIKIMKELRNRGHEVKILTAHGDVHWVNKSENPLPMIVYNSPYNADDLEVLLHAVQNQSIAQAFRENREMPAKEARSILEDSRVVHALQSFNADVALYDLSHMVAGIVADYLQLPKLGLWPISVAFQPSLEIVNVPTTLAFEPQFQSLLDGGRVFSFTERLKNLGVYLTTQLFYKLLVEHDCNVLRRELGIAKEMFESSGEVRMLLVQSSYALDPVTLLPPHVRMIGPLLPEPAKPLPNHLLNILESYEAKSKGVVYVSFGTTQALSGKQLTVVGDALNELRSDCVVVWRLKSQKKHFEGFDKANLGPHVHVLEWVPQNDLLEHPNVKLFVTHGGHNSVAEAAYHAVPIVGLPQINDQVESIQRAEVSQWGIGIQKHELNANKLISAVRKVLTDPSFGVNAKKVAKKLRYWKPAVQQAGDWIEYAIEMDLEPFNVLETWNVPPYRMWMLDCWLLISGMVTVILWLSVKLCCFVLCRNGRGRRREAADQRTKRD